MLRFQVKLVLFKHQTRNVHISRVVFSDFYSVLGINPKSTQSEIKAAYYKLSKLHHPDMNTGEVSAETFRLVSEAYEILGNVKTRKLYDRGVIHGFQDMKKDEETPEEKFYKSRETRHRVPAYGKTTVYNFDQWTKEHYSETFASERKLEEKRAHKKAIKKDEKENSELDIILIVASFITILGIIAIQFVDNSTFKKK